MLVCVCVTEREREGKRERGNGGGGGGGALYKQINTSISPGVLQGHQVSGVFAPLPSLTQPRQPPPARDRSLVLPSSQQSPGTGTGCLARRQTVRKSKTNGVS